MEEMNYLLEGSTPILPPLRGEPLRARFCLKSIRLALKAECPYSLNSVEASMGYSEVPNNIQLPGVKYHVMAILK